MHRWLVEHGWINGDSGGPVFWGQAAYGLHRGRTLEWLKWRDMWSRADYIDEALDVEIATD